MEEINEGSKAKVLYKVDKSEAQRQLVRTISKHNRRKILRGMCGPEDFLIEVRRVYGKSENIDGAKFANEIHRQRCLAFVNKAPDEKDKAPPWKWWLQIRSRIGTATARYQKKTYMGMLRRFLEAYEPSEDEIIFKLFFYCKSAPYKYIKTVVTDRNLFAQQPYPLLALETCLRVHLDFLQSMDRKIHSWEANYPRKEKGLRHGEKHEPTTKGESKTMAALQYVIPRMITGMSDALRELSDDDAFKSEKVSAKHHERELQNLLAQKAAAKDDKRRKHEHAALIQKHAELAHTQNILQKQEIKEAERQEKMRYNRHLAKHGYPSTWYRYYTNSLE